jgi:branched-chain amino acid transport system substrate-binding protein
MDSALEKEYPLPDIYRTGRVVVKTFVAVVAALALGGIAAGCGSNSSSAGSASASASASGSSSNAGSGKSGSSKPYKVFAVLALSGPVAAAGAGEEAGLKAAAAVINARGGILGRKVQVQAVDDAADPQKAATALQQQLNSSKPDMVFPGSSSDETVAMCPLLAQNDIIGLAETGSAKITPQFCPTEFQVSVPEVNQEAAAAKFIAQMGYKRVGVIVGDDELGQSINAGIKQVFPQAGLTITKIETVDPTATNVVPQLQQLRASNPQVIYRDGQGTVNGFILKARAQLGWNIPFVGGPGMAVTPLPAIATPAQLKGVTLVSFKIGVQDSLTRSAPVQAAIKQIKSIVGPKIELPFLLYAWAYDSLFVVQKAAEQTHSTSTAVLEKKLETWGQTKPSGGWISFKTWAYTPQSHYNPAPIGDFALAQPSAFDSDGLLRPVK